jgi:hypothetical protein
VRIELTAPQLAFVNSTAKFPAILGGLGSGKTRAGTMRAVKLLVENVGANIGIFLPTYDLLKLRAMPGVEEDLIMLGLKYTINKAEYKISVKGFGFIIFRSYDNPTRIVSFEIAHSIIDELDTLKIKDATYAWRKISERTRQKIKGVPNTIGLVTIPDQGYSGFAYSKWGEKSIIENYELIEAPTYSNPFLPDGYIEQIKENYDPLMAEMYISGKFISLSKDKVYHYYDRKKHDSNRILADSDVIVCISIDFNIGGCCAIVFIIDNHNPIAVDEFVSHDTRDFIQKIDTIYHKDGRKITIYPDSTGGHNSTNASSSDLDIIETAGYLVDCEKRNPFIRDRINCVNNLISKNRLLINTEKCQRLAEALESQGYDKKGDPEKLNIHPSNDDWNDSLGYFCNQRFPLSSSVKFSI